MCNLHAHIVTLCINILVHVTHENERAKKKSQKLL